jgi:hypothetical protein
MTFKIEFSDTQFRLIVISPSGEDDYLDPVLYCSVSPVVGPDGVAYGAIPTSTTELDQLTSHPTNTTMRAQTIKVYDLTAWPNLKPVEGTVTIEEIDFDNEEDEDEEEDEPGEVIDVQPV